MPLIAVTRLRVRSFRFVPAFVWHAMRSARQAQRSTGILGIDLVRESKLTFWTVTAWTDEDAMRAFMMAPPHRKAMARLPEWCDEAAVVHWEQKEAKLPDWHEAHRRLAAHGRPSKVYHPSADHSAFRIPPPTVPMP